MLALLPALCAAAAPLAVVVRAPIAARLPQQSPTLSAELESYLAHVAAADAALRLGDAAEVRRWLERAPRAHRDWEWSRLAAAGDASLRVLEGCAAPVTAVAATAAGSAGPLVAAGDANGAVRLWEAASGRALGSLRAHEAAVTGLAFSADGARLASASADRTATVWDLAAAEPLATFRGHGAPLGGVAFLPETGTAPERVATSASAALDAAPWLVGEVRVWDPVSGAELARLEGGDRPLGALAVDAAGTRLAAVEAGTRVLLWDLATGGSPRTLAADGTTLSGVALAADGACVAAGGKDGRARAWDVASGRVLRVEPASEGWVHAVALDAGGALLAAAGEGGALRLAALDRPAASWTLAGHAGGVRALAFVQGADDARLVSGASDQTVRLWDVSPAALERDRWALAPGPLAFAPTAGTTGGDARRRGDLAAAHAGRLALGGEGATLVDVDTGRVLARLARDAAVGALAWSPDGARLALGTTAGEVRLLDATTGAERRRIAAHERACQALAWSPDGTWLASGGGDRTVALWDPTSDAPRARLEGHGGPITALACSTDGRLLASAAQDGSVRTWNAEGGYVATLAGHRGAVDALAFAPPAAGAGGAPAGPPESSSPLGAGPALLATGGQDGSVLLWNAETGRRLATLEGHAGRVRALAFAPGARRLASAGARVLVWDVATGARVHVLRPGAPAGALAFDAPGVRLAASLLDGTLRVWDAAPLASRLAVRERRLAAERRATPRVEALLGEGLLADAAAERLRADSALDGPALHAALTVLLARVAHE